MRFHSTDILQIESIPNECHRSYSFEMAGADWIYWRLQGINDLSGAGELNGVSVGINTPHQALSPRSIDYRECGRLSLTQSERPPSQESPFYRIVPAREISVSNPWLELQLEPKIFMSNVMSSDLMRCMVIHEQLVTLYGQHVTMFTCPQPDPTSSSSVNYTVKMV